MGVTTRLFTSVDDSSFIDVPTEEITGFEKELVIPEAVTPPRRSFGIRVCENCCGDAWTCKDWTCKDRTGETCAASQ